jgi:hypothetical protein
MYRKLFFSKLQQSWNFYHSKYLIITYLVAINTIFGSPIIEVEAEKIMWFDGLIDLVYLRVYATTATGSTTSLTPATAETPATTTAWHKRECQKGQGHHNSTEHICDLSLFLLPTNLCRNFHSTCIFNILCANPVITE